MLKLLFWAAGAALAVVVPARARLAAE